MRFSIQTPYSSYDPILYLSLKRNIAVVVTDFRGFIHLSFLVQFNTVRSKKVSLWHTNSCARGFRCHTKARSIIEISIHCVRVFMRFGDSFGHTHDPVIVLPRS